MSARILIAEDEVIIRMDLAEMLVGETRRRRIPSPERRRERRLTDRIGGPARSRLVVPNGG